MQTSSGKSLTLKVKITPEIKIDFIDWQSELNAKIATFPGFISLEIVCPVEVNGEWVIVQRFDTIDRLALWRQSETYKSLLDQLGQLLPLEAKGSLLEEETTADQSTVTEVFVAQVCPNKEAAFREWIAKIHRIEASFPGFRGTYVQSPAHSQGKNWITFLQFDNLHNLDHWLKSPERQALLREGKPLIDNLESHRVASAFGGWFASLAKRGKLPPAWKQTMIVLLVLYPIVMLEMRYLSPLTATLNPSLGMFISNAISVALVSWPMTPLAIWLLGWWLSPDERNQSRATLIGTVVVLILYLLEVIIFWNILLK